MIKTPIILIGPMGTGKSTIAKLLSAETGIPRCELDEVRWDYYDQIGYDKDEAKRLFTANDYLGLAKFWKPLEAKSVEMVVSAYPNHVIDFGAGQSVYEDENLFVQVEAVLASVSSVILLLPSPDADECINILEGRFSDSMKNHIGEQMADIRQLNEGFIRHPSNRRLAKFTVYTKGKTPQETCAEILKFILPNNA